MRVSDERLKLAVFIDFDNIEIGVKTTLSATFDVGAVLEAIKERGEVVTKVAYGDWKRAGDHSRLLTQQAIRMVQRNVTPGGDKNGADINLALDALEMALTHDHINAFVIVGGDSDFISLVEKLKQYDKKVLVVGGRAFTSIILQKNCHEFIAYENIVAGPSRRSQSERARPTAAQQAAAAPSAIAEAVPLVRRALKVLSEREVSPQLGLFKSTLLQLDSTFSERNYGAGSFRDFAEKLAEAGLVTVKQAGRSLLVELKDGEDPVEASLEPAATGVPEEARPPVAEAGPAQPPKPDAGAETSLPPAGQPPDAVRAVQRMLETVPQLPRWPMYIRNVKQFIRSIDPSFDERRYGFTGILDLLRSCQREGVLRLERDRQGVIRVFPGAAIQRPAAETSGATVTVADVVDMPAAALVVEAEVVPEAVEAERTPGPPAAVEPDTPEAADLEPAAGDAEPVAVARPRTAKSGARARARRVQTPRKSAGDKAPAARARKAAEARRPRAARAKTKS
jgi:uncharacterized LabA/DUF88 family protein